MKTINRVTKAGNWKAVAVLGLGMLSGDMATGQLGWRESARLSYQPRQIQAIANSSTEELDRRSTTAAKSNQRTSHANPGAHAKRPDVQGRSSEKGRAYFTCTFTSTGTVASVTMTTTSTISPTRCKLCVTCTMDANKAMFWETAQHFSKVCWGKQRPEICEQRMDTGEIIQQCFGFTAEWCDETYSRY